MSSDALKLTPEEYQKAMEYEEWLEKHSFTKKWLDTCPGDVGRPSPVYERPKSAEIINGTEKIDIEKAMAKEIKIEKKQPTVEEYVYEFDNIKKGHQPQIPVGHEINGVKVIKPQTVITNAPTKSDEELQKEAVKNIKELSEKTLTKEEEEKIKEKLDDIKKVNEQLETIEAGSCVDKKVESARLPDELKIARYLAKQYRERMKKLFAEMTDEDIQNIFSDEKKEEIDSVIEEMIRPRYRKCKCNNEKSGVPEPIKKAFKKLGYVAPECKIVEADEECNPSDFDGICRDLMALHARKNKDYGNAAHESYKEFGLISYVIRLNDKMKRLKSLTKPGVEQEVKNESIEDTLMDLAAYAIMAIESLRS